MEGVAVIHTRSSSLEDVYSGRRVLITGHTGFKGSWLAMWLDSLGAEVIGLALPPKSSPSLFEVAGIERTVTHTIGDITDLDVVRAVIDEHRPEFVFHLAAQALVRRSYREPIETNRTNVLGTAHVLEAVRLAERPCSVVVVSSDKCYENREWWHGYRESDPMGGHDIYSMSKGATELVVSSYRRSFFPIDRIEDHGIAIASARAGNVLGGGDWAEDRIVPDMVRALVAGESVAVRNPGAIRPWQHVLEPLGGYLSLGAHLCGRGGISRAEACDGWNFGPAASEVRTVRDVVETLIEFWGSGGWEHTPVESAVEEAGILRLSIDKATARLGWAPRWDFFQTLSRVVEWHRAHADGAEPDAMRALSGRQIHEYQNSGGYRGT